MTEIQKDAASSVDLYLLSFPNKDIDYPTIALPLLAAAVKNAGFTLRARDIDVELKDIMTSVPFLERLHFDILPALSYANVNNDLQYERIQSIVRTLETIQTDFSFSSIVEMKRLMQTRQYATVFGTKDATNLCKLFYQYLLRLIVLSELITTTPAIEDMFPDALPFSFVDDLGASIVGSGASLVGVSYEGVQRAFTFWFLRRLRRKFGYSGNIVVGGPDPTFYRQKILNQVEEIDYLVYTEGEIALPRLLERLVSGDDDVASVPNLIYRDGSDLRETAPELTNSVPDILPDFSELCLDKYIAPVLPVQASRGCAWAKCRFCMHYKTYSRDFYGSPAEQVASQMEELQKTYNVSNFYFADDDFTTEYRTEIADAIIARNLKVRTLGYARFDKRLNREILSRWKKAGMVVLEFGMESGSQKVINHIKKGFYVDNAVQNLIEASELGLICKLLMFYDFPGEDYEDLQDSIDLITQLAGAGIIRYFIELRTKLELQPLAPLWKEVTEEGHPDKQYFRKIWEPRGEFSINTNYRLKVREEIKSNMLEANISRLNAFAARNAIITTNDVNLSVDLILEELKEAGIQTYATNRVLARM